MFRNLIFLFLLIPVSGFAQFAITGRVLNQVDTKPVANASVFLSNTSKGAKSTNDGMFNIQNVAPGKYDLVISIIGFETLTQSLVVNNGNVDLKDIILFTKTNALNEVKIRVDQNRDKNFNLYYLQFKNAFLGNSDFAKDCKILNPELLDFDFNKSTSVLSASSSGFLEIENQALGYKISYQLNSFTLNTETKDIHYEGPVLFAEIKGKAYDERSWQRNRKEAYEGSAVQFLRSTLNGSLQEDGFRVLQMAVYANPQRATDSVINARIKQFERIPNQKDSLTAWKKKLSLPKTLTKLIPYPLNQDDFISMTKEPGIFAMGCEKDQLLLMHNKSLRFIAASQLENLTNLYFNINKATNKELTLLNFKEPYTFFDRNGRIINPNSIEVHGAWGAKRVAELLPIDYNPQQQNKFVSADSLIKGVENKLTAYAVKHVIEKVHLHLDRPWYAPGDTIWFKAYAVSGGEHRLSDLGGVLYAELINGNDSVKNRLILPLDSGLSKGDFAIPGNYKSGTYRIRAYTNWMRNDSDYFYEQKVLIAGITPQLTNNTESVSPKKLKNTQPVTAAKPDMQFFPEGGELISGLRSKVAFKIIKANGLAAEASGTITDQDGNVVAQFNTQHLGMGQFALSPQNGKQYNALVTLADSSKYKFDLPRAKEKGFALTINNTADSVYVKVAANDALFNGKKDTAFYLVAQLGGKSYFEAKTKLEDKVFTTRIDKARFPTGIVQFTLFSQSGEPLNERVIFVENDDQLKLKLLATKPVYALLAKAKIELAAMLDVDKPVTGSFSVAVTDETKVPADENAESTIVTDLLLSSELRGHIENPGYYFTRQNDQTRADLDLLMLSQGYRRFDWKKILNDNTSTENYRPEMALSISGNLKTNGNKAIANGKVKLTSIKDRFAADTLSDANGDFVFNNIILADTTKVIIDAKKAGGSKNVKISVNRPTYPAVSKTEIKKDSLSGIIPQNVVEAMEQAYRTGRNGSLKNVIQLKEVKIKSSRNTYFNPAYSDNMKFSSNLNGPGNADEVILSDKIMRSGGGLLSQILPSLMMGVLWSNGMPYSQRSTHISGGGPMALMVEGIQIGMNELDAINPDDIYSIEVLRSVSYLSIYGSSAPNGAIIITMKHGSNYKPENQVVDGLITYQFMGFYKAREFYSPKYDVKTTAVINDDRKTIYWNPDVITDANGKASFEFFNASSPGTYRVVVEGIDGYGNLGRQVFRYKVE